MITILAEVPTNEGLESQCKYLRSWKQDGSYRLENYKFYLVEGRYATPQHHGSTQQD
jgi:hypothetical protein